MNLLAKVYQERKKELEEKYPNSDTHHFGWGFKEKTVKILASQKSDILATIEAVEKEVKKKISIHKQIEADHEVYPKDWHNGNIQFGSDILDFLKEAKKEINQDK